MTRSLLALLALAGAAPAAEPIKALILDGQNNHNWKSTTPVLKAILTQGGMFSVDVATSPLKGTASYAPEFAKYQVVVSNYNGEPWPAATQRAFVDYVKNGGGFVAVHAANNSFPEWPEYNAMIGLGGWGGRSAKSGPYIRVKDGEIVRDTKPGNGGSHGRMHPFVVETVKAEHPIVRGLPTKWLHANDELYDRLRGPAANLTLLAVAYSDPKTGGSGEREPMIFTVDYDKGRVFHTPMGHDVGAMQCAGFAEVLRRGTEWAATGKVTPTTAPADFPTADKVSQRK